MGPELCCLGWQQVVWLMVQVCDGNYGYSSALRGKPANFLDVGGAASKERVTEAFKIILSDKKCRPC